MRPLIVVIAGVGLILAGIEIPVVRQRAVLELFVLPGVGSGFRVVGRLFRAGSHSSGVTFARCLTDSPI